MLQISINGIISASLLAIVSWSFGIIFNTTKIFHLAHSIVYTITAYLYITFYKLIDSIPLSIVIALAGSILIGLLMEWIVYRPLYNKGVNQNITLVSSIGLQMLGINTIALIFKNDSKQIVDIKNFSYEFGTIIITKFQFIQLVSSVAILLLLATFFTYSNKGIKIRAVSIQNMIASVIGINVLRIRNLVFILGSLIAGISALLYSLDKGIAPNDGTVVVFSSIVIVLLNKKDKILTLVLLSVAISLMNNLTQWYFSSEIKEAVIYFVLIVAMLWRTEGILAYKMRVEEK
jgi:branched-chain amino acid transport system permease protein